MATISSEFVARLEKIRVQFLFDHPFLSVLALSLPSRLRQNQREAMETDGRAVYIDEARCVSYGDQQLKYLYAHILLHIILKHPFRMSNRDAKVWNRSSDIVINLPMSDFERIGERPKEEVMLEKFRDKSVEEVYQILYQESTEAQEQPDEENQNQQKQDLIQEEGE